MYKRDDVPKYRKKSIKTVKKSNHKHIYKDCLLYVEKDKRYYKGNCCNLCGKVGEVKFFETEEIDSKRFLVLSNKKIFERNKHLEVREIDNIFDKYIKQ